MSYRPAAALTSTTATSYDDRFYVEVLGRFPDGTSERLGGTWAADMSERDTVVLGAETFDDPGDRTCGKDDRGWALSNDR